MKAFIRKVFTGVLLPPLKRFAYRVLSGTGIERHIHYFPLLRHSHMRSIHGLDRIFVDTTNICNLRCPFCFNDWKTPAKRVIMTEDHFKKVIELIPLSHFADSFLFSCAYEPTLNPNFIAYLKMIPRRFRSCVIFTTNLTIPLSDETIEELSLLNISRINISLDSLNPAVYEDFRKNANFEIFKRNIERLVTVFAKSRTAPPIRYISMVLKSNIEELPALIETCATRYLASENELRCMFLPPGGWGAQGESEWITRNRPTHDDWNKLLDALKPVKHRYIVTLPAELQKTPISAADSWSAIRHLHVNSDGSMELLYHGTKTLCHLDAIASPFQFFVNLTGKLWKETRQAKVQRPEKPGQIVQRERYPLGKI